MEHYYKLYVLLCVLALSNCKPKDKISESSDDPNLSLGIGFTQDSLIYEGERHFNHLEQLTNGGDNAEAYWSFDNSKLIFQATYESWNAQCDQIFIYDLMEPKRFNHVPSMVSTGQGRTTCSYFLPGNQQILYGSTHHMNTDCPPTPSRRPDGLYVWPIYDSYDIFVADLEGNIVNQLTDEAGYDAEATVSPAGDKIVFTSLRTGDLELFTMNLDGSGVQQVTDELGYDGGAFFSPDGKKLIFRASRPKSEEEISVYKSLLGEGLVQPTQMELFICNVDGSDMRQITQLGNANWAPFFHPSGERIIFSSNHNSEKGFPFNLFMINVDGSGLEQITYDDTFDSFPMFSYDGKYLSFSSNRNNGGTRSTNLFVAEWKD